MININRLYKEVYAHSVNKVYRLLNFNRDDAEDIVHQAFLDAIRYKDAYDPDKGTPKVWFNKILYNQVKTFKKQKVDYVLLDDELLNGSIRPEIIKHIDDEINEVRNYNHRRILELFYRNGYSTNEIAKMMAFTRSGVTTVCNRFKKKLSEKYGEHL